jgi:hypothetical protein
LLLLHYKVLAVICPSIHVPTFSLPPRPQLQNSTFVGLQYFRSNFLIQLQRTLLLIPEHNSHIFASKIIRQQASLVFCKFSDSVALPENFTSVSTEIADPSGRAVKGVGLRSLAC